MRCNWASCCTLTFTSKVSCAIATDQLFEQSMDEKLDEQLTHECMCYQKVKLLAPKFIVDSSLAPHFQQG